MEETFMECERQKLEGSLTEIHNLNLEEWAWYILDVVVATWSEILATKRT